MRVETWTIIPGYPKYEVSDKGRVRTRKSGRIHKQSVNKADGYLRVGIDGTHKYVHRLVMNSFSDGGGREGMRDSYVRHKDGNRLNNNFDNLEYIGR